MTKLSVPAIHWLESVLAERLGHHFVIRQNEEAVWIELPDASGWVGFDTLLPVFHESRSDFPCGEWDAAAEGWQPVLDKPIPLPGLAQPQQPLVESSGDSALIHYDILGLTYWMLSRLEEVGRTDLDEHSRFPATSSHAFQHGYLERPIVDEWLNVLGQVIRQQWPGIELRQHRFEMKVSHDVDRPTRYGYQSAKGLMRVMGGDVLKRGDIKNALQAPLIRLHSKRQLHRADPYNTFDWIMDQSDAQGMVSAFYFICGRTHPRFDAQYDVTDQLIRQLIRHIHARGHEIGVHPSYNTYQAPELLTVEANRLLSICAEERIKQKHWGGRMHYLRWEQPITLRAWNDAGAYYDSTLGYADRPGFRCGTCFEYPAFDFESGEQLNLRLRPLVAMECTVLAEKYMGIGGFNEAFKRFQSLKETCRSFGGYFTLLWHNSEFANQTQKDLYQQVTNV